MTARHILLLGVLLASARRGAAGETPAPTAPAADDRAREAIARFREAFQSNRAIEARENEVFNLREVPNDLVLNELEKLLRNKEPRIRNVAALAMGGQRQNPGRAGDILMKSLRNRDETQEVAASAISAMTELRYTGYWPDAKAALEDERSSIVVATLGLLGANRDWRAFPDLVDLYREIIPRRVTWQTGEVVLPDGTDAEAKAKWEAKYGAGGSKERAKAVAKAKSYDRRNFSPQIRACVKRITGLEFENAFLLEEWWCENYLLVARKTAEFEGKDPEAAAARARAGQAKLKEKVAEERRRMEEEAAAEAKRK